MRKIVHRQADHNIAPTKTLRLLTAGLIILGLSACNNDGQKTQVETAENSQDCGSILLNIDGWHAFSDVADRLATGQTVPAADLEAFANEPIVKSWRLSQAPNVPRVLNLTNWLTAAWVDEKNAKGKQKRNINRTNLVHSYRYSQGHSAQINKMLAELASDEQICQLRGLAESWVAPERIPSPWVLNFLPTLPELRVFEGEFFIDTGVLQAGGIDQTKRQLVSLLYRKQETIAGPNPANLAGEPAIAESFRIMMNEGIASWIEQTLQIHFDEGHWSLGKVSIVPEVFLTKTQETLNMLDAQLPALLDDPQVMADRGGDVVHFLIGRNAFAQTGLGMATVIVAHLGEGRLQEVHSSVPDFLAAYQEAALLNSTPIPLPGKQGIQLYESVPALSPEVFEGLHSVLTKHFPTQN